MTYLEMVNNILTRMRERNVNSVAENAYSSLIGVLVNDAKREVEHAWDWSALRTTITVPTVASTADYAIAGSQSDMKIEQILNTTEETVLKYVDSNWVRQNVMVSGQEEAPVYYTLNGVDANDDMQITLYPTPDGVYSIDVVGTVRQADLSLDADVLTIPTQPVLMLAWAKAIEERGEDAGVMTSSAYVTAQRVMADHISIDANRHVEELIWKAV